MILGSSLLSESCLDESFFEPAETSGSAGEEVPEAESDEKSIMEAIASLEPLKTHF